MKNSTYKVRLLSIGAAAGLTLGSVGTAGAAVVLSSHAVKACSTATGVLKLEQANGQSCNRSTTE